MLKSIILKRTISAVLVLVSICTIGTFSCFAYDPPKEKKNKEQEQYEWIPSPDCLADYQYDGQIWIDYEYIKFQVNYERDYNI